MCRYIAGACRPYRSLRLATGGGQTSFFPKYPDFAASFDPENDEYTSVGGYVLALAVGLKFGWTSASAMG